MFRVSQAHRQGAHSCTKQLLDIFCMYQSYRQLLTVIHNVLAGVPGVARDEKLRKQIFEITWRDKGWIG